MRRPITLRLDRNVLKAAMSKAGRDSRTLTNYIETLLRRDLQTEPSEPTLEVIAPEDIRNSVSVPMPGETEEERKRRDAVFFAVVDAGGY